MVFAIERRGCRLYPRATVVEARGRSQAAWGATTISHYFPQHLASTSNYDWSGVGRHIRDSQFLAQTERPEGQEEQIDSARTVAELGRFI
ncbi:hypothetical protein HZH68_000897 [Vespula germanica]|uniref:Uncharacterized protein n=1 Tax=Vespula germanica TaxID=30212 RepID=A0A834NUH8_VESGE|nr:hypothetical protein HZH68_000897 [Vespula germanica]